MPTREEMIREIEDWEKQKATLPDRATMEKELAEWETRKNTPEVFPTAKEDIRERAANDPSIQYLLDMWDPDKAGKYGIFKDAGKLAAESIPAMKVGEFISKLPIPNPVVKAGAAALGSGLTYAGTKAADKIRQAFSGNAEDKPVTDLLSEAGSDILEGATYELGGQAAGAALSKAAGAAGRGLKTAFQKAEEVIPRAGEGKKYKDIAEQIKKEPELFTYTDEQKLQNEINKALGLEPLTPAQMQQNYSGQPTKAQLAEMKLKTEADDLFSQQEKQYKSLEDVKEKMASKGKASKEEVGEGVRQAIKSGKKQYGEIIGDFKKAGETIALKDQKPIIPIKEIDVFELGDDFNEILKIDKIAKQAKNVRELDAVSSNVGQKISEARAAQKNNLARKLIEVKNSLEEQVSSQIEESGIKKPREAYEAYAGINNITDDVLKGVFDTGGAEKIINRVTSSAENVREFKKLSKILGKPELVTTVKSQYIADLLEDSKWRSKWIKARRSDAVKELLDAKSIKEIDTLVEYATNLNKTNVKAINPSGTALTLTSLIKQPASTILNTILGDELPKARALRAYKQATTGVSKSAKESTTSKDIIKSAGRVSPYAIGDTYKKEEKNREEELLQQEKLKELLRGM